MNATADAFMAIFGYRPCTCENCTHALPSVVYPLVYCPVKGKPVQKFERCKELDILPALKDGDSYGAHAETA